MITRGLGNNTLITRGMGTGILAATWANIVKFTLGIKRIAKWQLKR